MDRFADTFLYPLFPTTRSVSPRRSRSPAESCARRGRTVQRRSLVLPRRRLETRPRRSKSALVVGTVHHSGEREVLSRHTRTPPMAAVSCTSSLQHRSVIRRCLFPHPWSSPTSAVCSSTCRRFLSSLFCNMINRRGGESASLLLAHTHILICSLLVKAQHFSQTSDCL